MGLRACALKKREIELGNNTVLNWASEELEAVISNFCEDYFTGRDYADTDTTWEVNKEQFKEMIDKIENLSDEEYDEIVEGTRTYVFADEVPSRKIMLEALKALYADGVQAGKEYIYIVWV